jgi:hypothetical protein
MAYQSAINQFHSQLLNFIEADGHSTKHVFPPGHRSVLQEGARKDFYFKGGMENPNFKVNKDDLVLLFCSKVECYFTGQP